MDNSVGVGQAEDFFANETENLQKIYYGSGSSKKVGGLARELGQNALLVTDQGLSAVGHVQAVVEALESAGLQVTLFDQSIENPTESSVQTCTEAAQGANIDLIIGLGGGSSMDTAKGCNFILTNGGRMADYWGVGKATRDMLPMIALPTTAGTGSECQSFALISEDHSHRKMACGDKKALPLVTILDPELTLSQPRKVTACTGIDALTHALESAVTKKRNDFSDRHSLLAFGLIHQSLPDVFSNPDDLFARGNVLLGASHAGAAIERSMLGAAHSMANPLTARRGVVHGIAVGLALPVVIKFNCGDPATFARYAELSLRTGLASEGRTEKDAVDALIVRVRELLKLAEFPLTLQELGFMESDIESLAAEAAEQWTAGFNPRSVSAKDFAELYSSLFSSSTCQGEIQGLS